MQQNKKEIKEILIFDFLLVKQKKFRIKKILKKTLFYKNNQDFLINFDLIINIIL